MYHLGYLSDYGPILLVTTRCGPACRVVWVGGGSKTPSYPDYAFITFTIFELSITTSLQSLQRQEMFNAGCMFRLTEFSSTEPMLENCPGCFSFLSRQIIPRPANENPLSIGALHFGHFSSCHTISDNFVLITIKDPRRKRTGY